MRYLEPLEGRWLFASYAAGNVTELIAAMNAANASAQADTIALAAGATFSLAAVDNADLDGPSGLPVIAAGGGELAILGNGATIERSTATGTPAFRLFAVADGASLALNDLTLQGGLVEGRQYLDQTIGTITEPAHGGGIYNRGVLKLDGVTVRGNSASGLAGQTPLFGVLLAAHAAGGGIYSTGSLTITASTIQNNTAVGGAGNKSVANGTFNTPAGVGANGSGGGIYVAGGSAVIDNSSITSNVARGGFGGPLGGLSNLGGNGYGGGLYAAGGSLTLRNATVNANAALGGGSDVRIPRKTAPSSPGNGIGGGIYLDITASAGLDRFTVRNTKGNAASTIAANIFGTYAKIV